MSVAMVSMGLYPQGSQEHEAAIVVRLGFGSLRGTALLAVVFCAVPDLLLGRGALGLSLVLAFIGISAMRERFAHLAKAEARKRRVQVLRARSNAATIAELEAIESDLGLLVVGLVPCQTARTASEGVSVLDPRPPLAELAMGHGAWSG